MRVFLAILLLVALALVGSSQLAFRARRWRPVMVLESGGWLAMGVGVLIGPDGAALVEDRSIEALDPLLLVALGLIGLLVGLGLRRELLAALPRPAALAVATDALVTLAGLGTLAGVGLWWATGGELAGATLFAGVALAACASLGWSMETRSLRAADSPGARWLAIQLRGAATVAAALALLLFAPVSALQTTADEPHFPSLPSVVVQLIGSVGVGVTVGVMGRFALGLAGRSRGNQLAVMLGIVAMVTGVAVQLGLSPAFAALVAGATVANLQGTDLRAFERFILKTEHVVATLFAVLAGVLVDLQTPWELLVVGLGLGVARLALKPMIIGGMLRRASERAAPENRAPERSPLYLLPARAAPIAMVIAVSALLIEPTPFVRYLLTTIVVAGVASDVLVLAVARPTDTPGLEAGHPRDGGGASS